MGVGGVVSMLTKKSLHWKHSAPYSGYGDSYVWVEVGCDLVDQQFDLHVVDCHGDDGE
jgi:hypothetical protein